MGKQRVTRTRNNGTWTEAMYWNHLSSVLRQGFRYWKPIQQCKQDARRRYKGNNKRQKWEYKCNHCNKWFGDKEVQIDHVVPVGKLRALSDIAGVVERLTTEDGFQCLCKDCHAIKTNSERIALKST